MSVYKPAGPSQHILSFPTAPYHTIPLFSNSNRPHPHTTVTTTHPLLLITPHLLTCTPPAPSPPPQTTTTTLQPLPDLLPCLLPSHKMPSVSPRRPPQRVCPAQFSPQAGKQAAFAHLHLRGLPAHPQIPSNGNAPTRHHVFPPDNTISAGLRLGGCVANSNTTPRRRPPPHRHST